MKRTLAMLLALALLLLCACSAAPEPTQLDRVEAQVAYTAMMTDTMLEV